MTCIKIISSDVSNAVSHLMRKNKLDNKNMNNVLSKISRKHKLNKKDFHFTIDKGCIVDYKYHIMTIHNLELGRLG